MGGHDDDQDKPDEHNFYLDALIHARDTSVPDAKDGVFANDYSDPATIKQKLYGAWECDAATTWCGDLTAETNKVSSAFDDGLQDVRDAVSTERSRNGETVPAGHPHGKAFQNSWQYRWKLNQMR